METLFIDKNYQLVNDCKNGDRTACQTIYRLYAKSMLNIAYRIIGTRAEAEDILQESFIVAVRNIKDFRQETTFGLWMKQIVVSRALSALRKRKAEWIPMEDECLENIADEEQIDDSEIRYRVTHVKDAIANLAEGYRVILSLYLLEGYDYEEISGILNITVTTARVQFMRAKRKLLEMLSTDSLFEGFCSSNERSIYQPPRLHCHEASPCS